MLEAEEYRELVRRYGLDPVPESVLRLTALVSEQNFDLEAIARVIDHDPDLKQRLLRLANPRAASAADYTVETVQDALFQRGVGCALLLAMGTPLTLTLVKAFQTMLALKLETLEPLSLRPIAPPFVLGELGFSGKATGVVCLRVTDDSARHLAGRILGLDPDILNDPTEIEDAVGELLNIITGNFKSHLCDAGLDCRLHPPKIWRSSQVYTPAIPGGSLERMVFRAAELLLFVDVAVNPWGGE